MPPQPPAFPMTNRDGGSVISTLPATQGPLPNGTQLTALRDRVLRREFLAEEGHRRKVKACRRNLIAMVP
ncbi:hypothetical protein A0H81_10688 [Grifola frondosa]|uniref:Uncharacterized protein n=1 Tax=Grifola frondosa TaxID=5627 RepID=A0A1C7LXH0_GRIFR|nr:hypothetical protein A0H81_10688 [Grifola frondosa]